MYHILYLINIRGGYDMPVKRLFGVKDSRGRLVKSDNGQWFDKKTDAKLFRDSLEAWKPYHVCRGPDHMGKHGTRTRNSRTCARRRLGVVAS